MKLWLRSEEENVLDGQSQTLFFPTYLLRFYIERDETKLRKPVLGSL